jgi:hypothetical protein
MLFGWHEGENRNGRAGERSSGPGRLSRHFWLDQRMPGGFAGASSCSCRKKDFPLGRFRSSSFFPQCSLLGDVRPFLPGKSPPLETLLLPSGI